MRRFAILAGLCVAVLAVAAGPAMAGGPTSVLLVAPETGRTAALYVTQSSYERLSSLVQTSSSKPGNGTAEHAVGPSVRLTWLVHDVSVWRVDEVYVEAPGGPWIATRVSLDDGPIPDEPIWHRAGEPGRLIQLLGSLDVLDPDALPVASSAETVPPVQADAAPVQTDAAPAAVAPGPDRVSLSGWRWVLPGLLAGAALAYLAVRLSPSWQRREPEPRWELIDQTEPSKSSTT